MIHRAVSLLGTVALLSLATACGSSKSASDGVIQSVDGLSVIEIDEAAGRLVAKFEKAGRTIHFDLRLGPKMETPPTAEELAANPELPTYQADALVTDAARIPIYQQMGGDSFIDPSWDPKPRIAGFHEADRLLDIQLLRDAGEAFRKLAVPSSLDQLRLVGLQIGRSVDTMFEKPGAAAPTVPATGDGTLSQKAVVAWGPDTVAKWDYRIRAKCLFGCAGKHSAVHLRGWSSGGSIVYNASSCNHGSCATWSDMATECVMSGYRTDDGTNSRYFYSDTTTSNSERNGGCSTTYYWNSGPGGHNCNDDTTIQRNAIYYDSSQDTSGGTCSAAGSNYYPPGCH